MSYPPPRYAGDTGEVTATYRPADHEPELVYANGNSVHYLATGATTLGDFGLYRWVMGPGRSGPDPTSTGRSRNRSTSSPARSASTTAPPGSRRRRATSYTSRR